MFMFTGVKNRGDSVDDSQQRPNLYNDVICRSKS